MMTAAIAEKTTEKHRTNFLRVYFIGHRICCPNVKEHATLSARATVDHGVEVENTKRHLNSAADRGCCVSPCSAASSFSGCENALFNHWFIVIVRNVVLVDPPSILVVSLGDHPLKVCHLLVANMQPASCLHLKCLLLRPV